MINKEIKDGIIIVECKNYKDKKCVLTGIFLFN